MSDLPESVLAQSLLLPELGLLGARRSRGHLTIDAQKQSRAEVCVRCATLSHAIYDHRWITVKDEPIRSREVILRIFKRRFYCHPCGRVFSEPVPGILPRRRTTQRFRRAVLESCESFQSLSKVIAKFRCSSSLIYTALYEQLELRRRTRQYPWPEVIGIDEISFKRNRKFGCTEYATVIVDIKNKRLIEVVLGKRAKDLMEALAHIPGRENVKWVVMDMCDAFKKFTIDFFPNAQIVADKFHVIRLPTPYLIKTLKNDTAPSAQRRRSRRLMLSRPENLDYFERSSLYRFLDRNPKLRAMYTAKEKLFGFYSIRFSPAASGSFEKLIAFLEQTQVPELLRLARTLKKWKPQILGYFQNRLTNGMVEGFNNKIKLVKRMAYGYRSFRNFRLRVLNACAA